MVNKKDPNKSLDFRRDHRTVEEFGAIIQQKTDMERVLIDLWANKMRDLGRSVEIFDNGIDNSGKLTKSASNEPDFRIILDGAEFLCEVKSNPVNSRNTFKVDALMFYIKRGAKILLFYNMGREKELSPDMMYAFIEPENMVRMIADIKPIRYDKSWGFKEVVIVKSHQFHEYFESHPFFYDVKESDPPF